jgi:phosphatidylglycerophosphate synthase
MKIQISGSSSNLSLSVLFSLCLFFFSVSLDLFFSLCLVVCRSTHTDERWVSLLHHPYLRFSATTKAHSTVELVRILTRFLQLLLLFLLQLLLIPITGEDRGIVVVLSSVAEDSCKSLLCERGGRKEGACGDPIR